MTGAFRVVRKLEWKGMPTGISMVLVRESFETGAMPQIHVSLGALQASKAPVYERVFGGLTVNLRRKSGRKRIGSGVDLIENEVDPDGGEPDGAAFAADGFNPPLLALQADAVCDAARVLGHQQILL